MSSVSMPPSAGSIKRDRHSHQPWLMVPSVYTCVCCRAALIEDGQRCILTWTRSGYLVLITVLKFFPVVTDKWPRVVLLVTPSVTWVVWMNWPIMGNIQELQANNRRMITPRLFYPWWLGRSILKVGRGLVQNCVRVVKGLFLMFFLTWCFTGKVLIIGGSIANFTNVAATFKVQ